MPVPDVDPGLHYRDRFVDFVDEIHCSVVRRVVDDDDVLRLGPGREERTRHGPRTPTPLWATTTTAQRTERCSGSRTADIAWALIAVAAAAVESGRLVVAG